MKDPMRLVDRFCYKHPHFGIPNLMRDLTIANVVFWLIGITNQTLLSYLGFDAVLILRGQIWRLLTFMLYPPSPGVLDFLVFQEPEHENADGEDGVIDHAGVLYPARRDYPPGHGRPEV